MGEQYRIVDHEKPFQYKEGDFDVTRGCAWTGPGCHLGCGVVMYTDADGKLVKCEGDPEDPWTNGRLCMRCLDVPEVTHHKERLQFPMKRDPKDRGLDKWERISWDEAYDLITEKFMDMKEKYGAESVVFAQGTGRDIAAYITRLCWSFGSPNYTGFLSGQCCYLPRIAGMAATTGAPWIPDAAQQFPERYDHPDYEVPEVMFIWGNYPLKSNIEGFYGHWVIDLMKRGMKIVTVDPKVTWLATKSELHLRVRPGTDAALALGMMKVIIDEDLYDHEFVDNWCYGFEELKERADEFDTKRVSEITWVPEDKIVAAARMLGNAKNSTLQWGVAVDMTREAMPAGQAILALWEITGNMERPGGMIVAPEILSVAGGWGREILGRSRRPSASASRTTRCSTSASPCRSLTRPSRPSRRASLTRSMAPGCRPPTHRVHGRRPAAPVQRAEQAGLHRGGRPVQDAHHRRPGRRGAAGLHVPRAQRHRLRVRRAARFHHQQGHRRGRVPLRHADQPGTGQALESRGMAVGQRGRDVHRHAEAHRDVVRRAAERRAGLPAHRVLPLREGHAAQGRPARLQHPDGPHRAVEQLLQTRPASTRCRTSRSPSPAPVPRPSSWKSFRWS